jgi:hypothetical protein
MIKGSQKKPLKCVFIISDALSATNQMGLIQNAFSIWFPKSTGLFLMDTRGSSLAVPLFAIRIADFESYLVPLNLPSGRGLK